MTILKTILFWLFEYVAGKLAMYLSRFLKKKAEEKKVDEDAKASVEPLKHAQTIEETNAAIDKSLSDF